MVVMAHPEWPHKVHTDASTVLWVVCCCNTTHKPNHTSFTHMTMVLVKPQHKHTNGVMECIVIVDTTQVV